MAKKQKSVNVRKLRYQEAFDILTGGSKDPRKFPQLPIDDWLKQYSSIVRPPEELRKRGVTSLRCSAREAIAVASAIAFMNVEQETGSPNPQDRIPSLREAGRRLKKCDLLIQKTLKLLRGLADKEDDLRYAIPIIQRYFDRRDNKDIAAASATYERAISAVRAAVDELNVLSDRVRQEAVRLAPLGAPGDSWKITFVIVLGYFYRTVTGKNPSYGSISFRELVDRAYWSLGGDVTVSFDRARRTACNHISKRPLWDGWGRYDWVPNGAPGKVYPIAKIGERRVFPRRNARGNG